MMDYEKMSDRELDKAVAVKVMGWKPPETRRGVTWLHPSGYGASESGIPAYSTSIGAALTVVEKIKGLIPDGIFTMAAFQKENYAAGFMIPQPNAAPASWHWVEAPTLPRAICECALKAMEASK
jgi:hypothetical protein